MPYIRYEADAGRIGGGARIEGPTCDQDQTASEASQKKYVALPNDDAWLEWTIRHAADGVVVRFTLPDSADGMGLHSSLTCYVNGQHAREVPLTSYHAWQYWRKAQGDQRHPLNDPKRTQGYGSRRMRFDETRFRLDQKLKPGDTLQLRKGTRDGVEVGIDFIEVEEIAPPIDRPVRFLDVTQAPFAASPNDNRDDFKAFEAAVRAASQRNQGLYIPPGRYVLSDQIKLDRDGLRLRGAGIWHTELHFSAKESGKGGIAGRASSLHVSDVYLTSALNSRDDGYRAFGQHWGKQSTIENVWLTHFSVGFWIGDYSGNDQMTDGLRVRNARIRNTYADGLNFAKGTSNSVLEYSDIRNTGDDGTAMWSSDEQNPRIERSHHNTFRHNTIEFVYRAAGIGVFGGRDHQVHHCIVSDAFAGAGVRVNSTFPAWPFVRTSTTSIHDVTVVRCGTRNNLWDGKIGAVNLAVLRYDVTGVMFDKIDIVDAQADAIRIETRRFEGALHEIADVRFKDTTILGAGLDGRGDGFGIYVDKLSTGSLALDSVSMHRIASENVFVGSNRFVVQREGASR
jgi:hypothetical protein